MKGFFISFIIIIILLSGLVVSLKLTQTPQNPRIKAVLPSPADSIDCPPGQVLTRKYLSEDRSEFEAEWKCVDENLINKKEPVKTFAELNCGCRDDFTPVCGRDYQNYPNDCVAKCKNTGTAYLGPCLVYQKENLPPGCKSCEAKCDEGQVFFEDEYGCPVCECRTEASER